LRVDVAAQQQHRNDAPLTRHVALPPQRRHLDHSDETLRDVNGLVEVQRLHDVTTGAAKTRLARCHLRLASDHADRETWIRSDDRTLVVRGLHGFDTVLRTRCDESDEEVGPARPKKGGGGDSGLGGGGRTKWSGDRSRAGRAPGRMLMATTNGRHKNEEREP